MVKCAAGTHSTQFAALAIWRQTHAAAGRAADYSPICFAMITFMISLVPA